MFLDSVGRWRWHEQGPSGVELMNHSLQSVSMGVRCYVMLVVIKLKISEVTVNFRELTEHLLLIYKMRESGFRT